MATTAPVATWDICAQPQTFCVVPNYGTQMTGVEYTKKKKCTIFGLALTELIIGASLIGIGIACIPICDSTAGCGYPYDGDYYYYLYYGVWTYMGTNIWGGALVVLFSCFGIAQAVCPSSCTISANLGLSIVGAIICSGTATLESIAAAVSWRSTDLIILHSIAASLHFILCILFIVSGSYAGIAQGCRCRGCCCDPYEPQTVTFLQQSQPHVVTMNGQTVIMQGNPNQIAPGTVYYGSQPPMYSQAVPGPSQVPVAIGQNPGTDNAAFDGLPRKM